MHLIKLKIEICLKVKNLLFLSLALYCLSDLYSSIHFVCCEVV